VTRDRRSIKITGGTFQGSAIGIGRTEQHGAAFRASATVEDLRTALAAGSAEIVALGRDEDERNDLRHELRKIEKELQGDEPEGAAVRTRWKSVLAALEGVRTAGTAVVGITELVRQLFGG